MPRFFVCVARPVFLLSETHTAVPCRKASGGHAGVYGTDFSTLWLVVVTLALHTDLGVDYIDVSLGNCANGTLGHADPAGNTIIGNF